MIKQLTYRLVKFLERFIIVMIILNGLIAVIIETDNTRNNTTEVAHIPSTECDSTCSEKPKIDFPEE